MGKAVSTGGVVLAYIGPRPRMFDNQFGTGDWDREGQQIKQVPADVATKMLRHRDVWEEVPEAAAKKIPAGEILVAEIKEKASSAEAEAEESQKVRDVIAAMDSKQAIADFIAANYAGMKVDKRVNLDAMKQSAVQIVDQFGVTP